MDAEAIREALRVCFWPGLPLNLLELGRVDRVTVEPEPDAPATRNLSVRVVLLCEAEEDEQTLGLVRVQVINRLLALEPVFHADVDFSAGWTAALATPAAQQQLARERRRLLGLVEIDLA